MQPYNFAHNQEELLLFSVGFSELLLILFIAYVFVGPQDLPKVTRWIARVLKRTRQLIAEVKNETGFDQVINETKEFQRDIKAAISENDRDINENLRGINNEMKDVTRELESNINDAKHETFKK